MLGAFSLGLASVLIAIGLVAVYGCKWLERLPTSSTLQQHLPVASAIAIIVAGAVLTGYAVI